MITHILPYLPEESAQHDPRDKHLSHWITVHGHSGIVKKLAISLNPACEGIEERHILRRITNRWLPGIQKPRAIPRPDVSTFILLPWKSKYGANKARFTCEVRRFNGKPLIPIPGILKRQLDQAKEMGYAMNVSPEIEFFYNGHPHWPPEMYISSIDVGAFRAGSLVR